MGDVIAVPQPALFAAVSVSAANLVPQRASECAASGCGSKAPSLEGPSLPHRRIGGMLKEEKRLPRMYAAHHWPIVT